MGSDLFALGSCWPSDLVGWSQVILAIFLIGGVFLQWKALGLIRRQCELIDNTNRIYEEIKNYSAAQVEAVQEANKREELAPYAAVRSHFHEIFSEIGPGGNYGASQFSRWNVQLERFNRPTSKAFKDFQQEVRTKALRFATVHEKYLDLCRKDKKQSNEAQDLVKEREALRDFFKEDDLKRTWEKILLESD